jgi:hypothetical protein
MFEFQFRSSKLFKLTDGIILWQEIMSETYQIVEFIQHYTIIRTRPIVIKLFDRQFGLRKHNIVISNNSIDDKNMINKQ